jgi:putative ABC transport system ATP-binding protein
VVLLGPSGSGKSTLLNILGGLDAPSGGEVRYLDHMLTGASETELTRFRREHVGFVFQFYNLIPSLTARENVAAVTEISAAPMRPEDALGLVGLGNRLDHFPAQLSGGEQQRVAIARAVAKNPAVLLCDEPTGALDSATGVVVLECWKGEPRARHVTVLITHNAGIADMADRVIRLSDGQIAEIHSNATKKPRASSAGSAMKALDRKLFRDLWHAGSGDGDCRGDHGRRHHGDRSPPTIRWSTRATLLQRIPFRRVFASLEARARAGGRAARRDCPGGTPGTPGEAG